MKTKIITIGLALTMVSSSVFIGCKKDKDEDIKPQPTQLELTVLNTVGNKVSGAEVTLYDSETNYDNSTSPISTKTTDANGKVVFSDLSTIKYYWHIEKECDNNAQGAITTTTSLTANVTNTLNVVISPKPNSITLSSYEDESYYYYVNGSYIGTIGAYGYEVLTNLSAGTYNVEFKEVDYVFSQTTYSGSTYVSCGDNKTLTFGNKKK